MAAIKMKISAAGRIVLNIDTSLPEQRSAQYIDARTVDFYHSIF
jgi:hypothetical protein